MEPQQNITLISSDGDSFIISEECASLSAVIQNIIEDVGGERPITLSNVRSDVLIKIIEFMNFYADHKSKDGFKTLEMREWEKQYMDISTDEMYEILVAANYLNTSALVDLGCETVAKMLMDRTPEEIRAIFKIKNDFTPEEEEENRRANGHAFE